MKTASRCVLKFILLIAVGIAFAETANAQLDMTFGTNGTVATDVYGNDRLIESFVLPNDKILAVVSGTLNSQTRYYLVRYNANGTLDAGYGTNGVAQLSFPAISTAVFTKAARQSNGKIVLTGSYNADSVIVSINEDGTLDAGFAGGGIQRPNFNPTGNDKIDGLGIQPDGKIVISSSFTNFGNYLYFVRYLPNGTLDPGFGNGGVISHVNLSQFNLTTVTDILFQSTGKIITKGTDIRRFNADGSIDGSFPIISSPFNIFANASVTLQSDDKILLAGSVDKTETLERFNTDIRVLRYTADGLTDTTFGSGGSSDVDITNYFYDEPLALVVEAGGRIIVGGNTLIPPNKSQVRGRKLSLARLSPSGQIIGKFLVADAADYQGRVKILSDGKILTISGKNYFSGSDDLFLTRSVGVPMQTYRFKGAPFDFVYDGIAEAAVFRPSNQTWYYNPNIGTGTVFGTATDIRVPSDYIGILATDLAVFRPENGTWYIARESFNPAQNFIAVQWGQAGDIPVPEDYDGDGKSDIAVFRPSSGAWYIRNSADNSFTSYQFGASEDKPVTGDYDGDGKADIAVFRPSSGTWYLLKSTEGFGAIRFGASEDVPVQEDYDGDGKTDIAVFRPSSGYWYRINSGNASFTAFLWGLPTDKPVPADYDGDSKTDIAVWRPSNAQWYVFRSSTNSSIIYNWGTTTDLPLQVRK
jgi:uncharacterized delta-60 repeat protein